MSTSAFPANQQELQRALDTEGDGSSTSENGVKNESDYDGVGDQKARALTNDIQADDNQDHDKRLVAADNEGEREWLEAQNTLLPVAAGFAGTDHDWHAMSRQVWQLSRLIAGFLLFAMIVGWPIGDYMAHRELVGSGEGWSILGAYPTGIILFALVVPALVVFVGYVLSRAMTMAQAGEQIADAARYYVEPNTAALQEVETVGTAVRAQMDVLNTGLNTALMRLADAEAMIRKHVEAIETAGEVIETRTSGAIDRVASERTRLMDLTETLNLRADDFANAIAERTEANIAAMERADNASTQTEARFDERLSGLETAAGSALASFQNLVEAISGADNSVKSSTASLIDAAEKADTASQNTIDATRKAQMAASEAVNQSVLDAASLANLETVKQAVAKATESTSDEALTLARAEATRIAQEAVKSAGLEIEKIAKQAGETIEATAEQAAQAARSRKTALAQAHAELEEENVRLEKLIEEQQARAERLATVIAAQTQKLADAARAMPKTLPDPDEKPAGITTGLSAAQFTDPASSMDRGAPDASTPDETQPVITPDVAQEVSQDDPDETPMASPLRWRFGSAARTSETSHKAQAHADHVDGQAVGTHAQGESTASEIDHGAQNPHDDLEKLDDLARDLAERRAQKQEMLSASERSDLADRDTKRDFGTKSWKDILAAADGAEPLDLGLSGSSGADKAKETTPIPTSQDTESVEEMSEAEAKAISVIARLQDFTKTMDARLYGTSPPGLVERYTKGDRNVFANRLLRLNENDVKKRIRLECAKDRAFEKEVRQFLSEFDGLLEEAAQSEFVDDELREYLGSPLGRMYLLIGEIVGYFA